MKAIKYFVSLLLCAAAGVPAFADEIIDMANPAGGSGWNFDHNVVTITANGSYVVTGTSTENRVVINKDVMATVTLQNATIRSAVASPFMLSSDSVRGSQVILILSGSNELITTEVLSTGLMVEDNAKLTIEGNGSLLAQGEGENPRGGAGIGGGYTKTAGTVIIQSGTVTAIGGFGSAGIGGGGLLGNGGSITVAGGTVTATGGDFAAGIGGGYQGDGGNITITGGTVTAIGRVEASGIGGGREGSGGNITVTGGAIIATGNRGAGIGGGSQGDGGNITVTGGTITATGGYGGAGIGGGENASGDKITVTGGTITATGGSSAAGIGGGMYGNGGNITINGGAITATGGGAGIGGGWTGDGGNISISNGIIVAVTSGGTGDPAGIGGGGSKLDDAAGRTFAGAGTINITGGTVYASGGAGLGIGGGAGATRGEINITGGTVVADEIGIGNGGATATNISGANTIVLSPVINTTGFGGATVLTGNNVNVSGYINTGDAVADVTLHAGFTIPGGFTFIVPAGIVFDVNYKGLTNNGVIRRYGSMLNTFNLTGNQPTGGVSQIPNIPAQTYTGNPLKPPVTVTDGVFLLTSGVHYSVAYTNNVNAGTATVAVTDLGDYRVVTKDFTITPKALAADWLDSIPPQAYTGGSVSPAVTVKDGDKPLTLNTDYTVTYRNNVDTGRATVTVTGVGNYTGSASKTFTITAGVILPDSSIINIAAPGAGDVSKGWVFINSAVTIIANGEYVIAGSSSVNSVAVSGGVTATITLQNVNIRNAFASPFRLASDNTGSSQVTLILVGNNELVATDGYSAGLTVEDNAKLVIEGSGSLLAQGAGSNPTGGAGIGGGNGKAAGTVVIKSGTVTATGGYAGAGIGGGAGGSGGTITVSGGVITANGGENAAAIGGGYSGNGVNITVSGGAITATGGYAGVGIGGGAGGSGGTITVSGGAITATGGENAAAIGGGIYGTGGRITVSGGVLTAIGGADAAGIGGGFEGNGGNISISNGILVAVTPGGTGAPSAIGGGGRGNAGTVNITGGTVYASGGTGIGAGATGGVINITGGTVVADKIGIGGNGSATPTNISGQQTIVLSQALNTSSYNGAQVLTGADVDVSGAITVGDNAADVTLHADLTIPSGATLTVPVGIIFDANYKTLTNNGIILRYGSMINVGNLTGNQPVDYIRQEWIQALPSQVYTGDSLTPAVTITNESLTLTPGIHYSVAYMNNVNAGTATVAITDPGGSHTVTTTFIIYPKTLVAGFIQDIPAQAYTGKPVRPAITVRDSNRTLLADTDYAVGYSSNVNPGTAVAMVTGRGNYAGTASKPFTIIVKSVAGIWIESIPSQTYTGDLIEPALTVRDGDNTLVAGTDYTVRYAGNVNVGEATVTVTGRGNYAGTASETFTIVPKTIEGLSVDAIPAQNYTGQAVIPAVTVRDGGRVLTAGQDYEVSCRNNTEGGEATAIITGRNNYQGEITVTFYIARSLTDFWIDPIPDQLYVGTYIEPEVVIGNLIRNVDYTVRYEMNINVGTATVIATGKGGYKDSIRGTFIIYENTIPLDPAWVYDIPDQTYENDGSRWPKVWVRGLVELQDFVVSYKDNYQYSPGWVTAYVIVWGINTYSGSVTKYYRILDPDGKMRTTDAEESATAGVLQFASADNGVFINGLTPGEVFGIYSLQGQLIYQAKASSPEEHIYLQDKGVYILKHKDKAYKFSR
ncbi:MAG: Ig-like domain-containing protein [Bacteroidales bacterium]